MIKCVLAGPPRSGKSVFTNGLKKAIRKIPGAPYPFVLTACPDGEGCWFQDTVNRCPETARALKEVYKAKFTPEFVARVSADVQRVKLPLTLVDVGGIPSKENVSICSGATHIVILSGDPEKVAMWREFASHVGLTVVSEIFSDYHGTEDTVEGFGPDGVLRGSVHYLERGVDGSDRPMIRSLADRLVALACDQA